MKKEILRDNTQNVMEKLFPGLFKNTKFGICVDQLYKSLHIFFNCLPSWGLSKGIETTL